MRLGQQPRVFHSLWWGPPENLLGLNQAQVDMVAPVFFKDATGFLGQRRGDVNTNFSEPLDVERVNNMKDPRSVVAGDVVAFEQVLDDNRLAACAGSCDNDGCSLVHRA